MSKDGHSDKLKLGFIAAVEVEGRGHVGGLLVTNHNGRPLEFQCTTPVKPDRTQEILYGKMLRPWLLGELIGKTLMDRVSIKPDMIFTSDPDILELRNHIKTPVACTSEETVSVDAARALHLPPKTWAAADFGFMMRTRTTANLSTNRFT